MNPTRPKVSTRPYSKDPWRIELEPKGLHLALGDRLPLHNALGDSEASRVQKGPGC